MIVFPENWKELDLKFKFDETQKFSSKDFIKILRNILGELKVFNLTYSGGIDSTIVLSLLSKIYDQVNTYSISCRVDHPDIKFARLGSNYYKNNHHEFIVIPERNNRSGDTAVKILFDRLDCPAIICCDGIDELTCGYYDHLTLKQKTYEYYLERLIPNHLIPLNKNSGDTQVYLPYLDPRIIKMLINLPLKEKINLYTRKMPVVKTAHELEIPVEIIERNKYGFCDAFREKDK